MTRATDGKRNSRDAMRPDFSLKPAAIAVAMCLGASAALANPTGPVVVNGQVSFHQAPNLLRITNSPNSIINWQSFSIGSNEITRFVQQSAASAVLNRVTGAGGAIDPSVILGALQSNGRVFLLNPSGIVFGAGSHVDVAGLVASTLDLSNQDFLGGRLRFTESAGAGGIASHGAINAAPGGQVYLVAPDVRNGGIITAPNGDVVLAAGRRVELVEPGTPNLRVEITAPDNEAVNLGRIVAQSGRIGIYAGLIEQKGTLRADSAVVGADGHILLKATRNATLDAGSVTSANGANGGRIEVNAGDTTLVAGTVEAKGAAGGGGAVHLLGENVGVYGEARVDASGRTGGGTVLVGGEFRGAPGVTAVEGAPIRNATATYFGPDARIAADATGSGDGGRVIVWADHTTRAHGAISARGGAASGNGGLVETSGKVALEVTRGPDLRAPNGVGGMWLVDPNDLEVVAGAAIANNTSQPMFSTLGESSQIGVDLINAQLNFGSNVVLTTSSQGPADGAQPGNITISAPIVKSATTTPERFIGTTSLEVRAHNDIVIAPSGGISSTGDPLNVTLAANNFSGTGTGGVTVNGAILTNGGFISISGRGPVSVNAPMSSVNVPGPSAGDFISISSAADALNVAAAIASGSSVSASGFTGVAINGAITAPSNSSISLSSATGPVSVNQQVAGGFFTASAQGAGQLLTLAAPVTASGASLTADDMQILANLTNTGGLTVRQSTPGTPINLGTNVAGSLSLTTAELARFTTGADVTYGDSSSGAFTVSAPVTAGSTSVAMNSGTSFTVSPGASVTTAVPLSVNAPTVTLNGPLDAQSVNLTADNIAVNAGVTSAGDLSVLTRSFFRQVNLGAASDSGSALDMSAQELNRLATGASGVLRIGSTSSGQITIQGPIAPGGTQRLALTSGSGIGQAAGGTITETNLALRAFSSVNLAEDNVVASLSASVCCTGNTFTFTNAPDTLLTIGVVDGLSGVSNSSSNPQFSPTVAMIRSDRLNAANPVRFDQTTVTPRSSGVRLNLGGADAAGVLGITGTELANFSGLQSGSMLTLKADRVDISQAVTFNTSVLAIAPVTAGRELNIVAGPKNAANLELLPVELRRVTGNSLVLGDATVTGPVTVATAANLTTGPGTVQLFTLRTGDPGGITVDAPLTARAVSLIANAMAVNANVTATTGDLLVVPNTGGTHIDLGGADVTGTLGLDALETARLFAPNGTIFIGNSVTGNVDITSNINFTSSQLTSLNITSGGTLQVVSDTGELDADATILLTAPAMILDGPVTSGSPATIFIAANTLSASSSVSADGDINVRPFSFNSITLGDGGGGLNLDSATLGNLHPGSGIIRVGDTSNTGSIQVAGPVDLPAMTLSLVTNNGSVTQTSGATLTLGNLAVRANGQITLADSNDVSGSVALTTQFGAIDFKHTGANALTIGDVDLVTGVSSLCCSGQTITLRADDMAINSAIFASSGSNVVILPVTANRPIVLGNVVGSHVGLTGTEIGRINASTVFIGDSAGGGITVTDPVSFSNSVALTTAGSNTIQVDASLTAARDITLTTGTLNLTAPVSSTSGSITATADAMALGAAVSANSGSISLAPLTAGTAIVVAGAAPGGALALGGAELGNLSYGSGLTIGSASSGDLTVNFAGALPGNVTLVTGGDATFQSSTFSAGGNLTVQADAMSIPGAAGIAAGGTITIRPNTAGLGITLGTALGSELSMTFGELNKISTPTGTLVFDTSGTLTVNQALAFNSARVSDLSLSGGSVNVLSSVSAAGDIALRGDAMDIQANVTSTGGGILSVSPRSFANMTLGSGSGSGLMLSSAEVNRFSTTGVLRLGNTSTTSVLTVDAPINPANADTLTLAANSAINQTAGSTITAPRLRLQTNGSIDLPETNNVDTLAGGNSFSTYNFTTAGLLTVGPAVDGVSGLQGGTLNLKADDLALAGPGLISTSSATLGPRDAGSAINLGANPGGGVFGIDGTELTRISSFTLTFGSNTSGPVTVSAPMQRTGGTLNILTAPTETVNVNGALEGPSGVSIDAGTINVSHPVDSTFGSVILTARAAATLNIDAAVSAGGSVGLNADVTNINAQVTANPSFGVVSIAPVTAARPVSLGVETSGSLSITQAELDLISAASVTLGSGASGPLTIGAPIHAAFNQLNLRSGGAITQDSASPVVLTGVDGTGNRIGSLDVRSGDGVVDMRAANEVPGSLIFSTGGTANDVDIANALSMKLQSVFNFGATGKVRINSGALELPAAPLPAPDGGATDPTAQLVASIERITEINDVLDTAAAEDRKREEEQKKKQSSMCN